MVEASEGWGREAIRFVATPTAAKGPGGALKIPSSPGGARPPNLFGAILAENEVSCTGGL